MGRRNATTLYLFALHITPLPTMQTPREPQENLVEYVTTNIEDHIKWREWKIKVLNAEVRKHKHELLKLKRIQAAVEEDGGDEITPVEPPVRLSPMEEAPRGGEQVGILRKMPRVRANG